MWHIIAMTLRLTWNLAEVNLTAEYVQDPEDEPIRLVRHLYVDIDPDAGVSAILRRVVDELERRGAPTRPEPRGD